MEQIKAVHHIDCLIGMQDIPDKSIGMILCDLPYGTTACKWDVIIPFESLWKCYERIIKDNGAIVLTASQPFTSMLVMSNIKFFRHEWIWDKYMPSGFLQCNIQPLRQHESILVFGKNKVNYYPIKFKKPYEAIRRKTKNTNNIESEQYGFFKEYRNGRTNMSFPKTIIQFNTGNGWDKKHYIHPTQKPVVLFEYLIKTYTNEGETVLDNCAGSGTTAIACINTNRNYILMEKEEKYYNIIKNRIKNHTVQLKLIA